MELNGKKVVDVTVEGVDPRDYPDFCDAFFASGWYEEGRALTDAELDELTEKYPEKLWDMAFNTAF